MGTCFADDLNDVNYEENKNLYQDDSEISSYENFDVSNNNSISENDLIESYEINEASNSFGSSEFYDDYDINTDDSEYFTNKNNENIFSTNENEFPLIDLDNDEIDNNINNLVNSDKIDTVIDSNNITKYYMNDTHYLIQLTDVNGDPLANMNIIFTINGNVYNRTTDEKGFVQIKINLIPGNYVISVSFNGNDNYSSCSINNTILILPVIEGKNIVKYYKNGTQYYATLLNVDGTPLANKDVTMNINGVFYTRTTDSNGIVKLSINLFPGEYILTVTHPNNSFMFSNNITVLSTVNGKNIVKYYKNGTQYYATILGADGNPLSNINITMNINGVFYTRTTDENGVVKLSINLYPGEYILTVIHPDDELMMSNNINVIKMETIINASDLTLVYKAVQNYSFILIDKNNNPLSDLPVYFKLNDQIYNTNTDKNGIAYIILDLNIGEYTIYYGYDGDSGYYSINGNSAIKIINSTTSLIGNDMNMVHEDNSYFNVTLTDLNGAPLVNETVTFIINGKEYDRTTNSFGVASINIGLYPGTYTIKYYYSDASNPGFNMGQSTVIVQKQLLNLVGSDLVMLPDDDSSFTVTLTQNGIPIADKNIVFTIKGITYTRTTDSSGIAKLSISLNVGYYDITYKLDDEDVIFTSNEGKNTILVNGTILTGFPDTFALGEAFNVLLTDAYGNPISDETIKFTVNGVDYDKKTNSEGIASITLNLNSGEYLVIYSLVGSSNYADNTGQTTITILEALELNSIISAAATIKNHIENHFNLPSVISIEGRDYSMYEFLYLLTVATKNINEGNFDKINVLGVNGDNNFSDNSIAGQLQKEEYLSISQNIINYYISTNKQAPSYVDSTLGSISFSGLVYAYSRVVAFYGTNGVLPSYVALKSVSAPTSSSVLNDANTISDLSPYLADSKNCQVSDPVIQALALQLTSGLTSDLAKATAIYNYVRDNIAYSFYYDTKYGAVGTISRGAGNCVDETHLVIALCRASGIPARYVHGTCTFSSATYGHVWAQVLIGDTWVVADATSSRNSFGEVVNWNNYNYVLKGKYSSISF